MKLACGTVFRFSPAHALSLVPRAHRLTPSVSGAPAVLFRLQSFATATKPRTKAATPSVAPTNTTTTKSRKKGNVDKTPTSPIEANAPTPAKKTRKKTVTEATTATGPIQKLSKTQQSDDTAILPTSQRKTLKDTDDMHSTPPKIKKTKTSTLSLTSPTALASKTTKKKSLPIVDVGNDEIIEDVEEEEGENMTEDTELRSHTKKQSTPVKGTATSSLKAKSIDHDQVLFLRVSEDERDMRLDRFVRKHFAHAPQSLLHKLLRDKKIALLEGEGPEFSKRKIEANYRLHSNAVIMLPRSFTQLSVEKKSLPHSPQDESRIQSMVIFKDDYILAINKPSGLACQGGSGIKDHVDKLLPYLQYNYPEKPRLVHRLDKEASGLLLLGRTRQSTIRLQQLFVNHHKIQKTYWALLAGRPKQEIATIRIPLGEENVRGEDKVVVKEKLDKNSKVAITHVKALSTLSKVGTLMAMFPETGRKHQLRVTCASVLNAPIVGDTKYGRETPSELQRFLHAKKHEYIPLYLHARRLRFKHPQTGKDIEIVAPVPDHFKKALDSFGIQENVNDNQELEEKTTKRRKGAVGSRKMHQPHQQQQQRSGNTKGKKKRSVRMNKTKKTKGKGKAKRTK